MTLLQRLPPQPNDQTSTNIYSGTTQQEVPVDVITQCYEVFSLEAFNSNSMEAPSTDLTVKFSLQAMIQQVK